MDCHNEGKSGDPRRKHLKKNTVFSCLGRCILLQALEDNNHGNNFAFKYFSKLQIC